MEADPPSSALEEKIDKLAGINPYTKGSRTPRSNREKYWRKLLFPKLSSYLRILERATGIEPVFPAWEPDHSGAYLQQLKELLSKMHLAFLAVLVPLPDYASSGGTLVGQRDPESVKKAVQSGLGIAHTSHVSPITMNRSRPRIWTAHDASRHAQHRQRAAQILNCFRTINENTKVITASRMNEILSPDHTVIR